MGALSPLLLLLLLPLRALSAAAAVDPETARLLAEANGVLDTAGSDFKARSGLRRHDYSPRYWDGLTSGGYRDALRTELPFGARTQPITEHPLNEHFRRLEETRGAQYADIYNNHPNLQYLPKYYEPSNSESLKYKGPKYESLKYESAKYKSSKYESPKYEKPKYKHLKYESLPKYFPKSEYVSHSYQPVHDTYVNSESDAFFAAPPRQLASARLPHPAPHRLPPATAYLAGRPDAAAPIHHLSPVAARPPLSAHLAYPEPESYHVTEQYHVTETYPALEVYHPPAYSAYPEHPARAPHDHRAGKALGRFSFDPEPYIETIAIAYHENERNFGGGSRHPKHHMPQYLLPHQPNQLAAEYGPLKATQYARRVPLAPPPASEYVPAPLEGPAAAPQGVYGRLVGGGRVPERTVTLTPYRVQVGTLYGLRAAGSNLSQTVTTGDTQLQRKKANNVKNTKATKEERTGDSGKQAKQT